MKLNNLLSLFILLNCSIFGMAQNGSFYDNTLTFLPDGSGMMYTSSLTVTGFPGVNITSASDLEKICVEMEHSYLGDLEMALECPNGTQVTIFNSYNGPNSLIPGGFGGGSLFLGEPINPGSGPGNGYEYCFSSTLNNWGSFASTFTTNTIPTPSAAPSVGQTMNPNGIYAPEDPFSDFIGCPIDGEWKLLIQDNWAGDDGYIFGWGIELDTLLLGHSGFVFHDFNQNCIADTTEVGIENLTVVINPGNYVVQTTNSGGWHIDNLPIGTYTATADTTTSWIPTCLPSVTFTVSDPTIFVQSAPIGMVNLNPCAEPDVSIHTSIARPCFPAAVNIQVENAATATGIMSNAYINVELDPTLTITNASLPYTSLGNNSYTFEIGDLYPNQIKFINISTTVDCNAVMGQTICNSAELFPITPCMLNNLPAIPSDYTANGQLPEPCTLPWDNSSIRVEGWCQNDSIYFEVTNTGGAGSGDMDCYTSVMVFTDTVLAYTDSLMLTEGETQSYVYAATGQTWIIKVPQHPLHPGNSNPTAFVELCGDSSNWTPNIINQYPLDDADPFVDIHCLQLTASYDPNDKQGFPLGVTEENRISRGDQLQYLVRFQNTGTDTAFTVVIRDTLDLQLNLFTVTPGVSSHEYSFKLLNGNVLEWTFNDILLPDSTTNEPLSNGFITFKVDQNPNLPYGSVIYNKADIYFDFNPPIITNETSHTIYKGYICVLNSEEFTKNSNGILVFPNPTHSTVHLEVTNEMLGENYVIFDESGRLLEEGKVILLNTELDLSKYQRGYYFLRVGDHSGNVVKLLKW